MTMDKVGAVEATIVFHLRRSSSSIRFDSTGQGKYSTRSQAADGDGDALSTEKTGIGD
jgi:hypothetical protein